MKSREERTRQAQVNRAKNDALKRRCQSTGTYFCVAKLMQKAMSTVMTKARSRVKSRIKHALNKERDNATTKRWADKNKDKLYQKQKAYKKRLGPECARREREKYHSHEMFALKVKIRARLRYFLKKKSFKKDVATFDLVGCLPEELRTHLQRQLPMGEEVRKYQVDHIFPLNRYTATEVMKMTNYHNLQPLTGFANNQKHDKLPTKLMASKVPCEYWPTGVTMDDLPDAYD